MKKGQLFEQPYVFIFAAVLIGLLLIFGFYVIRNLTNLGDEVDLRVLISKLNSEVKECKSLDYGSVCEVSSVSFSNIRVVCFIDAENQVSLSGVPSNFIRSNINKTIQSKRFNVYFEPLSSKKLKQNYVYIDFIKPSENPLCQNVVGSKVNLFLENKGDYVQIRR